MPERNHTEIWSTRLQREILALESSDDESKKIELLPPFIKAIGHKFNIESGKAKIVFRVDVELSEEADATSGTAEAVEKKKGGDSDENAANVDTDGERNDKDESESDVAMKAETKVVNEKDQTDLHVVLVLDASLYWTPDSSTARSSSPQCYPFVKPIAIIISGSNLFSAGSTIRDGDEVDIDLDWTPSIHLSDAATNVALKIRECVKRGEPLHPAKKDNDVEDGGLSGSLLREAREAKESLLETKKAVGAIFSSGLSSLSAKSQFASKSMTKGLFSLGESLTTFAEAGASSKRVDDGGVEVASREGAAPKEEAQNVVKDIKSITKGFFSLGESFTSVAEVGTKSKRGEDGEEKVASKEINPQGKAQKVVKDIPDIGEEIDLSEEPWSQCIGMYTCKAIKRPAFVEDAIAIASKKKEKEVSSAGSMFSRFAQSAKSAMEESFLMITDKLIIEFRASKLTISSGTVTFAINISLMAKLKFRREESLSLFFKPGPDDPLVYMCFDSALAVQDIQNVLKRHGVRGKHTNAATQRAVQMALNLVALIQQKEKDLIDNPTVDNVNAIMDLYRQAAEKFEVAGDPRHAEVMAHMKRFLNQQFTTSILDGTFRKSAVNKADSPKDEEMSPVPQGEILEQPTYNLSNDEDDDDDIISKSVKKEAPIDDETPDALKDSTMQNMDDLLDEAVKDMSDLGMEDHHINYILESGKEKDGWGDNDDAFAELDAMLNDADKELADLLSS